MTKQTNVERFDHWMAEIVKSKWISCKQSMIRARIKVATHHIVTAKNKINGRSN